MSLREEFKIRLKESLKSKNQIAMSTIRLIMAALKDRDITARGQGNPDGISDDEILSMLQSMIKQRRESIKMYRDAGREELAVQEENEIEVIQEFLPKQLDDTEVASVIDTIIKETGAENIRDMGKVMGVLKSKYAGQVDMGKAGALVKEKLG